MEKLDKHFSSNRSFETPPIKLSNLENHFSVIKTGEIVFKTSAAKVNYAVLSSEYIYE